MNTCIRMQRTPVCKLSYPKRVAHLQEDTAHVVATLYNNYRNDVITTTVKRQCYSVVGFDLDDI